MHSRTKFLELGRFIWDLALLKGCTCIERIVKLCVHVQVHAPAPVYLLHSISKPVVTAPPHHYLSHASAPIFIKVIHEASSSSRLLLSQRKEDPSCAFTGIREHKKTSFFLNYKIVLQPWRKFQIGIHSESIRIISKSVSKPKQMNLKNVFNLVSWK